MARKSALQAAQQEQYRWNREEHYLYLKLFAWYGPAIEALPPDHLLTPPWYDDSEEMRQIRLRTKEAWKELTGLPPLSGCDSGRWHAAAIAARHQLGLPAANVRSMTPEQLAKDILPWALSRRAAEPEEPEPLTGQQQEAFELIRDEGPLTGPQVVSKLVIGSESTFTRHYVPALKRHGIRNKRGLGYYHPDSYQK